MDTDRFAAARFALGFPAEDIPDRVLERAALLMLDTLGVAIAAEPMEAGRILRAAALRLYNAAGEQDRATLLFDGRRASRAGAAWALAGQIDNLDAHDGYNPNKGHVGVAVVPALAATLEGRPDLPGRTALAGLVIGYEVACRAGSALHATVSDYHTSGAWNALGVSALAARLVGLSAEELRHAWGIAEYHGPRSQMMREIANPTMLHDGSGQGALVGLSAVLMAGSGFTGAPAITVEAPEAAPFWTGLGTDWLTERQYVKPYPICRWAHAPIDAARRLCETHAIRAEAVASIEIRSFENAVRLFPGQPATTSEAQYSLPFAVAAMIVHGRIGVAQITGPALSDPRVAALVGRTRMIAEPRHEARFPAGRWADVTIRLTDGRVLASGDVDARGGPDDPAGGDEIVAKYMDFAVPVIGAGRAARIRDAALGLWRGGARFADFAGLLYAAPCR